MLYLYETTYPYPGMMDEYVDVMGTDLIPGLARHMTVLGVFRIAYRHRESFFLSELPKGVDSLEGLSNFVIHERDGLTWHREGFRYRDEWFDSLLEGLPFSPTASEIKKRQKRGDFTGNTVYYRLIYNVLPGKADEFLKAFDKELLPMEEKRGMKLAGCYRWFGACGGIRRDYKPVGGERLGALGQGTRDTAQGLEVPRMDGEGIGLMCRVELQILAPCTLFFASLIGRDLSCFIYMTA